MTSVNHVKNSYDVCLSQYAIKNVELKVIKGIASTNHDILQRRKAALKEEYTQLENVNYDVWTAEDTFCNEIWNFSSDHNFNSIFNQYSYITDINIPRKCQCSNIMLDDTNTDRITQGLEQDTVLEDLKDNIDNINREITIIRNKSNETSKEITRASVALNDLRNFSEEITELLRLIISSEVSDNINNTSEFILKNNTNKVKIKNRNYETNKKPLPLKNEMQSFRSNENIIPNFITAKGLIKTPNFHPCILSAKKSTTTVKTVAEKKNSTTVTAMTEISQTHKNKKDNKKFGKYVVKKQSYISLKWERKREHLQ